MMLLIILLAAVALLLLVQWGATRPDPLPVADSMEQFKPRWPALRVRGRSSWCESEAVQDGYESAHVAVLHCQAGPEEHALRFRNPGLDTCLDRYLACGGESACGWSCLHEGDCVEACPVDAIVMRDGLPRISESACTGCGLCVTGCPPQVLGLISRDAQLYLACQNGDTGPGRAAACSKGCRDNQACLTEDHRLKDLVGSWQGRRMIDYTRSANLLPLLALCPTSSFKDRIAHRPWFTVNDHCTGCGDCLPLCPAVNCILPAGPEADTPVGQARVRIDPSRCVGCGLCVPACEVQAIRVVGAVGYQGQA